MQQHMYTQILSYKINPVKSTYRSCIKIENSVLAHRQAHLKQGKQHDHRDNEQELQDQN
jgi:hypothetical protein